MTAPDPEAAAHQEQDPSADLAARLAAAEAREARVRALADKWDAIPLPLASDVADDIRAALDAVASK